MEGDEVKDVVDVIDFDREGDERIVTVSFGLSVDVADSDEATWGLLLLICVCDASIVIEEESVNDSDKEICDVKVYINDAVLLDEPLNVVATVADWEFIALNVTDKEEVALCDADTVLETVEDTDIERMLLPDCKIEDDGALLFVLIIEIEVIAVSDETTDDVPDKLSSAEIDMRLLRVAVAVVVDVALEKGGE